MKHLRGFNIPGDILADFRLLVLFSLFSFCCCCRSFRKSLVSKLEGSFLAHFYTLYI